MDKDIYKRRAEDLDAILTELYDRIKSEPNIVFADDGEELRQIRILQELEEANAKILLDAEINELKAREQDLKEQVSFETHETDTENLKLRTRELDIREAELKERAVSNDNQDTLRKRELDIRDREAETEHTAAMLKFVNDDNKLQVEKSAVVGRVAGEVLKVVGTGLGVAGTVWALKEAMKFEHMDEGGIIPSKFFNLIFKMAK